MKIIVKFHLLLVKILILLVTGQFREILTLFTEKI